MINDRCVKESKITEALPPSNLELGRKGLSAFKKGNYTSALRVWKPLADKGYSKAQNSMGVMYYNGFGVPQNYRTAAKWFIRAAKQDHKIAQYFLATLYDRGLSLIHI